LSVGYLSTHQNTSADSDLMPSVSVPATHLPIMVAAFDKAKLTGFAVRGTSIFVPRGQEAAYMAALVEARRCRRTSAMPYAKPATAETPSRAETSAISALKTASKKHYR